jgi:hypothetical protein
MFNFIMNLSTILHYCFLWALIFPLSSSFTYTPRFTSSGATNNVLYSPHLTPMVSLSVASMAEEMKEESLLFDFATVAKETAPGDLDDEQLVLLREAMNAFPNDVGSSEHAQMVESLLHRLLNEWDASLKSDDIDRASTWQPQTKDFAVAISAWEKSPKGPQTVSQVLSLLSNQRAIFLKGVSSVQPDLETMKSVFRVLSASRERGVDKRALGVFQSLPDYDLEPDESIYDVVITLTAKSRERGAAGRAENLLQEAAKKYPPVFADGRVSGIGVDTFNVVITAWAKSGEANGPERAEQLIVVMDRRDKEHGNLGRCNPNVSSFTSLIDACELRNVPS